MGDVLAELEVALRSNKEKATNQEIAVPLTCKAKAIRDFTIGAFAASGVVWAATRKLSFGHRLSYLGGAAALSGMMTFNRSLNSSLEQVLALQGTRMQTMLANIILTLHQDDPKKIRLLNKHFYAENVFDDSHLDQPLTRWRFRNYFGEIASHRVPEDMPSMVQTELEPEPSVPVQKFAVPDVTEDPFNCIFGHNGVSEETSRTDNQNNLTKRQARSNRRAQTKTSLTEPVTYSAFCSVYLLFPILAVTLNL